MIGFGDVVTVIGGSSFALSRAGRAARQPNGLGWPCGWSCSWEIRSCESPMTVLISGTRSQRLTRLSPGASRHGSGEAGCAARAVCRSVGAGRHGDRCGGQMGEPDAVGGPRGGQTGPAGCWVPRPAVATDSGPEVTAGCAARRLRSDATRPGESRLVPRFGEASGDNAAAGVLRVVRTLAATSDMFATLHAARERPHQSHVATLQRTFTPPARDRTPAVPATRTPQPDHHRRRRDGIAAGRPSLPHGTGDGSRPWTPGPSR